MSFGRGSPTAQENVDVVRRLIAGLNAHDLEGYLMCCHEDVELHLPVVAGVYEGREGIRRWFADIEDAGPAFHADLQRVEAVGDDHVLAFFHVTSTGRASGAPVTMETANAYDLIDGKISRIRIFVDPRAAREAVGLGE